MYPTDWSNSDELQRTWEAALVRIPTNHQVFAGQISDLSLKALLLKAKLPTIIYLHGCSGVWWGTYIRLDFFAENGFAVIAPASFARAKYPKSCEPATKKAGLYRDILKMRQYDALHAITNAKQLDWVDSKNIFLLSNNMVNIFVSVSVIKIFLLLALFTKILPEIKCKVLYDLEV